MNIGNEVLWKKISNYRHDDLCRRFSEKHKLSQEITSIIFTEMKRFIFISIISNEVCSPSKIVDEMWHEFIMHTSHYRDFCNIFNSEFIDHTPSDIPEIEGYMRTKSLAERIFGKLNQLCWPKPTDAAKIGSCTCSNKSCTCNCKKNLLSTILA